MQSLTFATGSDRYLRTNSGLTLRPIGCTENPIIAVLPVVSPLQAIVPTLRPRKPPPQLNGRSKQKQVVAIWWRMEMLQECHRNEQYGCVLCTFERVHDVLREPLLN